MKKMNVKNLALLVGALIVILALTAACSSDSAPLAGAELLLVDPAAAEAAAVETAVAEDETAAVAQTVSDRPIALRSETAASMPAASIPAATSLTPAEADALAFMREEEKLARDVYQVLAEQWGLPLFSNIAASEQVHMDSVKTLLDRYELADPAAGNEVGQFTNPDLQALYDQLLVEGSVSAAAALKVGAAIEEIDILDLQERLAQTQAADVAQLFANLMAGSENHLRAFVTNLERQTGEVYQPQYLDPAAYQEILNGSAGQGGYGQGGQGQGGQGQGQGGNGQGQGGNGQGGGRWG